MPMIRCPKGHVYDPARYPACPYCGGPEAEVKATRPKQTPAVDRTEPKKAEPGATVPLRAKDAAVDPVVGWLVCVDGPDRGRDYRIRSGRNFIGRAAEMDVCITSDQAVSRQKHAILSYDPRNHRFRLAPGESRNLVYLNDEAVEAPLEVKAYDAIELGKTRLIFVPFCGAQFEW